MKEIPTVLTANEIISKVLHRASTVTVKLSGKKILDERNRLIAKIDCVEANITSLMAKYEKGFPSIDRLSTFEKELIEILISAQKLHHALAALKWCAQTVKKIAKEIKGRARGASLEELRALKKEYYGRVSSVVKQISAELSFLNSARDILNQIPDIDMNLPTIVIAGFPNVGKSTLVRKLSSAKPEIAPYPFTTKGIIIGHRIVDIVKYQFIDTPGLLDRPLEERNAIEKQTILALRHLADIVLFLIDPTGYSGSLEAQEHLLKTLEAEFREAKFIVVETKADILKRENERLKISAETGEGLEELMAEIKARFRETKKYKSQLSQLSQ